MRKISDFGANIRRITTLVNELQLELTNMRLFVVAFLFTCFSVTVQAQVKKTLHQSFEIEGLDNINLDLIGEYEIVEWAGNSVLVETSVELYSASRDIYKFFKDQGRYDVKADTLTNAIHLASVDKERKPIKTKRGECFEIVRVRILVPEDFNVIDQNTLVRKESSTEEN